MIPIHTYAKGVLEEHEGEESAVAGDQHDALGVKGGAINAEPDKVPPPAGEPAKRRSGSLAKTKLGNYPGRNRSPS